LGKIEDGQTLRAIVMIATEVEVEAEGVQEMGTATVVPLQVAGKEGPPASVAVEEEGVMDSVVPPVVVDEVEMATGQQKAEEVGSTATITAAIIVTITTAATRRTAAVMGGVTMTEEETTGAHLPRSRSHLKIRLPHLHQEPKQRALIPRPLPMHPVQQNPRAPRTLRLQQTLRVPSPTQVLSYLSLPLRLLHQQL
jgi:hypothetical protein